MADVPSLKDVIARLDKDHKNAIRTKNRDSEKHPALSTGSLLCDTLLGIGGLARGRITEMFGKEGCGKCVALDTLVQTRYGYETLLEMVGPETKMSDGGQLKLMRMVRGLENRLHASNGFYYAGVHDCVVVTLFDGHTLKAKSDHRVRIINQKGRIDWQTVDELESRTHVVLNTNAQSCSPGAGKDSDIERATLCGILAGAEVRDDGCVLNVIDPDFQATALQVLSLRFKKDEVMEDDFASTTGEIALGSEVEEYISESKLREEIPHFVRMGTKAVQFAYLRALIRSRMYWDPKSIEMVVNSEKLAIHVQLLSENWGLYWGWFKTMTSAGDPEYKMYCRGLENAKVLCSIIGEERWQKSEWEAETPRTLPNQEENVAAVMALLASVGKAEGLKSIDPKKGCTVNLVASLMERLRKLAVQPVSAEIDSIRETWRILLNENTRIGQVATVKWEGTSAMGDLSVPNVKSYCTAGFISHNSTLAMTAVKQAALDPAPRNLSAYFDFEHAFDKKYARGVGIPVDDEERFLLIRPDSLEEGADIFWALHETGRMNLAVFDSVAAMTPAAMMDQSTGDSEGGVQVGAQAAKLKDFLMAMTKRISISGTTVVLINQLRAILNMSGRMGIYRKSQYEQWKVPEWFMPLEEDTAGGKTLKYMCTTRIRMDMVKPIMAERENDITMEKESTPVGNLVNLTIVKHKVAPPFRRGKVFLEYGLGFDNIGTVIQVAQAKKIIDMSRTGHYSINLKSGLVKGRGTEDLEKRIRGDEKILTGLLDAVGFVSVGHKREMFPQLSTDTVKASRAAMRELTGEEEQTSATKDEAIPLDTEEEEPEKK